MTGGCCTFKATRTACVLLTNPTTTLPCLTASLAYSTWNIRPCGELWSKNQLQWPYLNVFASYSQGDRVVIVVISEHLQVYAAGSAAV